MPTARELLEQADALMRRNRARDLAPPVLPAEPAPAVVDDVPELTEVAAAPDAEAGTVPEAVAPAMAPEPAQEVLPEAPAATVVADEAPPPAALPEGAGPPLREALARELASPTAVYPPPPEVPRALDDIPELTEIVEEIEAPSILDAGADFEMGEPSVWMEPGHGEVSILGRWPDVPVAAAVAGDDHGKADAADGEAEVGVLHVAPDLLDPALAAALPSDDVLGRDVLAVETEPETAPAAAPVTPIAFATEDEAPPADDETEVAWVEDEPAAAPVEDEAEAAPVAREAQAGLVDDEREAPAVEDQGAVAPVEAAAATVPIEDDAEAAPAADDAERWDRLAEEVRMQVLQRIDIFTDTGLQEQLARRLQPMVDRASADLVATINHHVGALMRAYVAEAIEREIEKWRAGSR